MTIIEHDYWCPAHDGRDCCCAPIVTPTERDGIKVGDEVMVQNRWSAVVIGFHSTHTNDVLVRWTGKRPWLDEANTIDRRQMTVRLFENGSTPVSDRAIAVPSPDGHNLRDTGSCSPEPDGTEPNNIGEGS